MGLLQREERNALSDLLVKLPNIAYPSVRHQLLSGIPQDLKAQIISIGASKPDLFSMINAVDDENWDVPYQGSWPVLQLIQNAIFHVGKTSPLGQQLQDFLDVLLMRAQQREATSTLSLTKHDSYLIGPIPSSSSGKPLTIQSSDLDRIVSILAKHAASSFIGSRRFFKDLVDRAGLPRNWTQSIADIWTGDANYDARALVKWSISKGINPDSPQFTTLGSILNVMLHDEVGLDDASTITALIFIYQLYVDKRQLENLTIRYQIPSVTAQIKGYANIGPDINWQGPTDELQLQSFLKPDPPMLDVGFLTRSIQRATSVCRIEIPEKGRQGTGFLIAANLLLTNYHVLKMYDTEDIDENARDAVIRFGCITADDGKETEGQTFKLVTTKPILQSSSVNKLDYVLLQVEDAITRAKDIKPAPYDLQLPFEGMGMHILQHPDGETMKVAINSNGITGVYRNNELVQYVTRASIGSSGSPCFNDDWKVVALHHAERSKTFGTIREGILFVSIYKEIKDYL